MIKITIKGTYRVKVAFDLFGRRITLWSKAGSFDESVDISKGLSGSRRHDFGPFEVYASLDETSLTIGTTVSDGMFEVWSNRWPLSEVLNGKQSNLNIKAKGLEVKATVSLSQEAQGAA